jgi:hypothetical protein
MAMHPFRAAWQTRDLDAWADVLATDVVLHSPIIKTPFRGRDAVSELFGVLFSSVGDFDIVEEFSAENAHVFFWRADVGGRSVEGADLLRFDAAGKISEITVLIRPLIDIATFAAVIGPPLGAKRGGIRGPVLRLLTLPLAALLRLADAIASRLTQRRTNALDDERQRIGAESADYRG